MEILNREELYAKTQSVNFQQVIERKLNITNKGFTRVTIDETLLLQVGKDIAKLLGGRHATQDTVSRIIKDKESTFLYHPNFSDIKLVIKEGKLIWELQCKQNEREVKQNIRDYFNRL